MFAVRSANKRFTPSITHSRPKSQVKTETARNLPTLRRDRRNALCSPAKKISLPNSASLALALVLPHINTSTDDESRVPGYLFETSKAVRLRITHCEVMPESPLECSCNEYNVCVCVCVFEAFALPDIPQYVGLWVSSIQLHRTTYCGWIVIARASQCTRIKRSTRAFTTHKPPGRGFFSPTVSWI